MTKEQFIAALEAGHHVCGCTWHYWRFKNQYYRDLQIYVDGVCEYGTCYSDWDTAEELWDAISEDEKKTLYLS